ncbi:dTMP kinase [Sphingomonas psychrotolerans]|uniref:Thymidylate kinase n=1 Tax=Sphingomonas psychrotolerans TaxID=1327635 RepID=A0ABU3N1T2_9SPHN|nr:dTMP kinase [Sphingomonas psychrotolerans]MDT8758518.1 dTMP kinase [Sphingomonas psychrotolerans]
MSKAACFYAVEGVDGSGKSGMVAHIVDHLSAGGAPAIATREPGGTPQGEKIRALLLSGADDAWDQQSELLMMTAARVEHVRRVILPTLARGVSVVSDRYVGSTIAYQGAGRGMAEAYIRKLHKEAVGDIWPDLVVVLDLDPEIGLTRSRKRLSAGEIDEGRFETLDLDFHRRIRQSFLDQAAQDPERHVVVDSSGTPEEVRGRAIAAIDKWRTNREG